MPRKLLIILLYYTLLGLPWLMAGPVAAAPTEEAMAAETVVEVIGTGRVQGDNVDAARSQAIANSLVTAIDQATWDLMPLEFRIERFQALDKMLYSQPGRFVHGYRVLTENKSGRSYRVLVEATVSLAMLRQYLADASMLPGKAAIPRILLLIAEQNLEDLSPNYWWGKNIAFLEGASEARMSAVMQQQGFQMIDHGAGMPLETGEGNTATTLPIGPNPNDAEALALGNYFQADIVVVALARAQSAGNVMGETYKTFKGAFTARALRTDTGEKIGEVFRTAVAMDVDPISGGRQALVEAGALAADALGPKIMAAWRTQTNDGLTATILVEGSRRLANFVKFRNLLQDLPMVSEVETSTIKPNEATLMVRFKGTTQALADAMMLKSFDAFGINISDISQDYIHLTLVPK